MIGIHWGIINFISKVLFILVLLSLPFSVIASTVFLFALIAFWSRIPGVGIVTPLWILYMTDLVDLFSMIVAINVGGVYGGMLAAFCNFVPRIAGITPPWSDVIKDSIVQPLICLFIPLIFAVVKDITVCMVIYSVLRQVMFFIANFIYPAHGSFPRYLVIFVSYSTMQTFINYLYGKYFGSFFNGLLASGVGFNWMLFSFASFVMVGIHFAALKNFGKKIIKKRLVRVRNDKDNVENNYSFVREIMDNL